jgi:WD40 repeat protein
LERSLVFENTGGPAPGDRLSVSLFDLVGNHLLVGLERFKWETPTEGRSTNQFRLEWWDIDKAQRLAVWNEAAEDDYLHQVALTPDGLHAVTMGAMDAKIWNTSTGAVEHSWPFFSTRAALEARYRGAAGPLDGARLASDRRQIALFRFDEKRTFRNVRAEFFEVPAGNPLRTTKAMMTDISSVEAIHTDAGWLVDGQLNVRRGHFLQLCTLEGLKLWAKWQPHGRGQFKAAFSADGRLLITVADGELRLWPLANLKDEVEKLKVYERRD